MTDTDWFEWHAPYEDGESSASGRLKTVQGRIGEFLEGRPEGTIRVVSACAGQGRDLTGVLVDHPARDRVSARLVELDERNVATARKAIAEHGLSGVEVVQADAAAVDNYAGAVPADLVMFCGVFGNISDADIERTVRSLPQLCAPKAEVIWTRGRWEPDITGDIRRWFRETGFEELSFDAPDGEKWSVGTNRLTAPPQPIMPGSRLFTFTR